MVRIGDTEFRFEVVSLMLRVADQAFRTDTGRQRNANEDSYFARAPLFVVADGMGGAQAGEVASTDRRRVVRRRARRRGPAGAAARARRSRRRTGDPRARPRGPALAGMGTTITAAIVDAGARRSAIGHVGDSRAYRLRGGKLERLTRDHSLVEEMRRKGQLTDAQAEDHPQRSIITRALGPGAEVEVDVQTVPGAGRRRLPDLLRRADDDARRRARSAGSSPRQTSMERGAGAGRRSQPGRRPRQHHRRRLPPRGRRGAERGRPRARR